MEFKIGTKIKVLRNTNDHSYVIGEGYDIIHNYGNGWFQLVKNGIRGNDIFTTDIELFAMTLEELKKLKKEVVEQLKLMKIQLDYMNKTNCEEFNDSNFMSWYLINILNSNDKDKEKKISKIINTMSNNININMLKNTF